MSLDLSIVRKAGPQDAADVLQLCRMQASEMALFRINEAKVAAKLLQALIPNSNMLPAICGIIGEPGALEASIFLEVGTVWYSDDLALLELWNFVHPDHRRSKHAQILIEFAKACHASLGLPLSIGVMSNIRTEAKVALYQRKLGKPVGAFFYYNNGKIT